MKKKKKHPVWADSNHALTWRRAKTEMPAREKNKTTRGVAISQIMRVDGIIAVDGSAVVSLVVADQTELTSRGLHIRQTKAIYIF